MRLLRGRYWRTYICVSALSCARESARGLTPDMKHFIFNSELFCSSVLQRVPYSNHHRSKRAPVCVSIAFVKQSQSLVSTAHNNHWRKRACAYHADAPVQRPGAAPHLGVGSGGVPSGRGRWRRAQRGACQARGAGQRSAARAQLGQGVVGLPEPGGGRGQGAHG